MNEDKATRYQRLRRRGTLTALIWSGALLVGLMWSGASVSVRTGAEWLATFAPESVRIHAAVVVYVVVLVALTELGSLPIARSSGHELDRRYGLSQQSTRSWFSDQGKAFLLRLLLAVGSAILLYSCIRISPFGWWIPAGTLFATLLVLLESLAPVLLLPLFCRIQPISHPALRQRLLSLAERAGTRALEAYEWGHGQGSRKANALLTGFGATRRILVSDTMLSEYSDDEIEVVLAHEIAHHVHGDMWVSLLVDSALLVGGFMVAARLLPTSLELFGLEGPEDLAGLPLIVLSMGAISLLMSPAAFALSRFHERRADAFALALTQKPGAFISAIRRLNAQNLAEEHPSTLVRWFFCSHPPMRERIGTARAFNMTYPGHGEGKAI